MTVRTTSQLYFDGCPNWHDADERLRAALVAVGRPDEGVEHVLVSTLEEAEASQFRGSPTVLVDGRDPFSDPDAPFGLACRLCRTEQGIGWIANGGAIGSGAPLKLLLHRAVDPTEEVTCGCCGRGLPGLR